MHKPYYEPYYAVAKPLWVKERKIIITTLRPIGTLEKGLPYLK